MRTKSERLEWRTSKITELRGIGLSYAEIAREPQVSTSLIGTDVQYLREQAIENIKEYTTQHLPEQYQICLCVLDTILKNTFVVMQKSQDNREKLAAMELFKDTHLVKLELLSNATSIDHALEYVRSKQQHQKKANKDSSDSSATTTGKQSVF